ncbi:MAG: DUF4340 domain-containing protein [Phycisphaerae bacterium]|jgi:hypothetical protein|nr:DUF4340 domain-containing protein [Phycisphaerae bacterium]
MKSKTTVFLIVALMACITYVAIRRAGILMSPDPDPTPENVQALFGEKLGEPVEVTVTSQTGGQMKFRADTGLWRIVEPVEAAELEESIRKFVKMLASIECVQRHEPTDSDAPDASVTGLDSPRWTVTLTDDRQQTYRLEVGLHVPLSGRARTYVRISGDKRICVAKGNLAVAMSRPLSYYRGAKVLAIPPETIMSVRIAGSEAYSLHRALQDEWIIKSGAGDKGEFPADKKETKAFLSHFAGIDAQQFVDDNPKDLAPYGLAPGSERLAVTVVFLARNARNPETRTITLGIETSGAGAKGVYAKLTDRPTVFTLPVSILGALEPSTLKLRDKTVLPITADAVTGIELTLESKSMTLAKSDGKKWNITAPTNAAANQQRVQLLLRRLAALKAVVFSKEKASESRFGFGQPRGTIRLLSTGTDKPITLEIGADSPARAVAFVRSSSADRVAEVKASEVVVFLTSMTNYYDAVLWQLPDGADVNRIGLKRPGDTVELASSTAGRWRLTKPLDAPVDIENVNSILDRLDNLTATRIVSVGTKTRAYYARGSGLVNATFAVRTQGAPTSQPAGKTHTFTMAILDRKVYGWMENDPLGRVGLFSGKLYEQFSAEIRRRQVLDFDPQSIDGIALTSGTTRMVLKKIEDGWKYPDDPALQVKQAAVKDYLDRIKGIRAIRFVSHDSAGTAKFGLEKSKAWLVLELNTKDEKTILISISRKGSKETANRYTSTTGIRGVFTISAETAASLARKIADFK